MTKKKASKTKSVNVEALLSRIKEADAKGSVFSPERPYPAELTPGLPEVRVEPKTWAELSTSEAEARYPAALRQIAALWASVTVLAVLSTSLGLYAFFRPKLEINVPQQPPAMVTVQASAPCPETVQPATGINPVISSSRDLLLTAAEPVWIQVKAEGNKTTLFEGVVPAGWTKTYTLSPVMVLEIRTGKPDALRFRLGEKELALNNQYTGSKNLGLYVVDGKKLLK